MQRLLYPVFIIICLAALAGCRHPSASAQDVQKPVPGSSGSSSESLNSANGDTISITGTVRFMAIEGGFFAIQADDGKKYDPVNLPESFKKDGLRVNVTARIRKNAISFHMYGAMIEIVDISVQ